MSLGSTTGSTVNADSDIEMPLNERAKGVSVLISAGNSNTLGMVIQDQLQKIQITVWLEIHQR